MRPATLTPLLLIAVMCSFHASAAEPEKLPDNAALKYYQAFIAMEDLNEESRAVLQTPASEPLPPNTGTVLKSFEKSLMFMQKAAAIEPCDWGLDESPDVLLSLPPLSKAVTLGKVAGLRARLRMRDSDTQGAIDDLLATMKMSHHMGSHPTLLEALIEYSISYTAEENAAASLYLMTPAQRTQLANGVTALAPFHTVARAMTYEKAHFIGYFQHAVDVGRIILPPDFPEDFPDAKEWRALIAKPAAAHVAIDRLAAFYDRKIEAMNQPYERAIELLKVTEHEVASAQERIRQDPETNVGDTLLAQEQHEDSRALILQARAQIHRAMLLSAIAYANDGPDAAARISDPVTGKPFAIGSLADQSGWIELSSRVTLDDKPITLRAHVQ
ncbi:MAG: hypothetical protein GC162_11755 [Planctomycetes bacterium]|nr:hypothetical protein [Planctomycetota bacterium]